MFTCPKCYQEIQDGALRCKRCGADTRNASPSPVGIGVKDIFRAKAPHWFLRSAEIVARLKEIAPEFHAWLDDLHRARESPPVAEEHQVEAYQLFAELMAISKERRERAEKKKVTEP
jgi:hypothetical protein